MAKDGLVDLKRTKAEKKADEKGMAANPSSGNDYPYGTRVSLDHDTMEKMGMDTPRVGDKFRGHFHGHVTSVSEDEHEGGKKHRRVEVQMHKLALHPHKGETGQAGGRDAELQKGGKAAMDAALTAQQPDNDADDDS